MAETYRKIPTSLRWKAWLKFQFLHMTSQSYDRQYFNAFTAAMMPIYRFLYEGREDADERIRERLTSLRTYYLCEQSFSGVIFGIIMGMEEQLANGAEVSSELISATRSSLMGPLSGMGDAIHGSTTRQIAIALTLPYCIEGSVVGSLLMLLGINITPPLLGIVGFPKGYELGSDFVVKLLQSGLVNKIATAAGVMAMFIMGGMTAKYVNITTILNFTSDINSVSVQSMLDGVCPGLLSIGTVFLLYYLCKKKVSSNWIILGTLVVGIVFSYLGVM